MRDQSGLGSAYDVRRDLGGELLERSHDDRGLGPIDGALAQPGRHALPATVECGGETEVGAGVLGTTTSARREPAGSVARRSAGSEVLRVGHHPEPELDQLRLDTRELDECRRLVARVHEGRVDVGDRLQRRGEVRCGGHEGVRHESPFGSRPR